MEAAQHRVRPRRKELWPEKYKAHQKLLRDISSWLRAKQNTSQAAQHRVRPRRKEL